MVLPVGTEENHENLKVICLWAEIWTRDLPNMKQECYPLNSRVWWTVMKVKLYDKWLNMAVEEVKAFLFYVL
jgi:hypothetical protein